MTIGRRSVLGAGLVLGLGRVAGAAGADPRVVITTPKGPIIVELAQRQAPITTANFLRYVDAGKYNGGRFYRASRTPGLDGAGAIQGGPAPAARLYAPIPHESTVQTGLRHLAVTLSMSRAAPGSATADFFICASDRPSLDAHPDGSGDPFGYAAFGQVVKGMAVVRAILALSTRGSAQMLIDPVPIGSMIRRA